MQVNASDCVRSHARTLHTYAIFIILLYRSRSIGKAGRLYSTQKGSFMRIHAQSSAYMRVRAHSHADTCIRTSSQRRFARSRAFERLQVHT